MYLQDRRGASKLSAVARKLGNDRGNLLWKCCNIRPSEIETLSANLNERAFLSSSQRARVLLQALAYDVDEWPLSITREEVGPDL